DPHIQGTHGSLTPHQVFDELNERLPKSFTPTLKGRLAGTFTLARRPQAPAPPGLPGWREDQEVRSADIEFSQAGTTASWDDERHDHPFDRFDEHRRQAIHRLTELVDGVVRQGGPEIDWRTAVRKAWQSIGANLIQTALP